MKHLGFVTERRYIIKCSKSGFAEIFWELILTTQMIHSAEASVNCEVFLGNNIAKGFHPVPAL